MKVPRHLFRGASAIGHLMGTFFLLIAVSMVLPMMCSMVYSDEHDMLALAATAMLATAIGLPLRWKCSANAELKPRHALMAAFFGWIAVSALSALPFVLHGSIPSFTDAFFEMMSGYTTTGATILQDIEAVPHGLLLWRSETHLLGGMGFVTLAVMLLPQGVGGLRLFRAESSPGQTITRERFTARTRDAMRLLWTIYIVLNLANIVLLMIGGLDLFEAACIAFGTLSTSGYAPYNASVGHFGSAYVDWVTCLFMFLGGVTFVLFFFAWRRDWEKIVTNTEFRWYCGILLAFIAFTATVLYDAGTYDFVGSVRYASFQILSIMTTTGFTTADYELWPPAAQMAIYAVCFVGACAGSTTSGIKVVHYVIILKFMHSVIKKQFFQPLTVVSVRLNGERVDDGVIHLALCYFIVNIFLVLVGGVFMALVDHMDVTTAMSSVIACLMNIGPGFGDVGPTENFAFISDTGKWFLSWTMLVGRLEMFSALVFFYPSFWKH